jgi:hypothetical protein
MIHVRRGWRPLLAIALPIVVVGAGLAFIASSRHHTSTAVTASSVGEAPTTTVTSGPDRAALIAIAREKAAEYGDRSPTRLQFVETTHGEIKAHFDSAGSGDDDSAPVVVMVVYGSFEDSVPTGTPPGPNMPMPSKTLQSTTMEISVDLPSMRADWGMTAPNRSPIDLADLGSPVQDIALT